MNIRTIIVDDHQIFRDGLKALITNNSELKLIAEAKNGHEAVKLVDELLPNLVIIDVTMPDLNGIEATRSILRKVPDTMVIGLSMHSDRRFVTEMFKAGAKGYLLKDCAFSELSRAIKIVFSGELYLSPSIRDINLAMLKQQGTEIDNSVYAVLTQRECEMLQLLSESYSTKQIASRCNISTKTVEAHRQHIMAKLKIDNLPGLTKYAIREGLTSLDNCSFYR